MVSLGHAPLFYTFLTFCLYPCMNSVCEHVILVIIYLIWVSALGVIITGRKERLGL